MKVIGLCRVSTDKQAVGPETQRKAMEAWCAERHVSLAATYVEPGVHGDTELEKRTELLAAIDLCGKGDTLLVMKRDRLARDPVICAMVERLLARKGAKLVSVAGEGNGDTPQDELFRMMMDAFARYELLLIRARTKAALATKRARGVRLGLHGRLGEKLVGSGERGDRHRVAVADEVGIEALAMARALRAQGMGYRAIVDRLGEVCPRPQGWSYGVVYRALTGRYSG